MIKSIIIIIIYTTLILVTDKGEKLTALQANETR